MSDLGLPVIRTQDPAPLEGQDVSTGTGMASNATAALFGSFGASVVARMMPGDENNQYIAHAEASEMMKSQGYDPSVLPEGGVYQSQLGALMNQQSIISRNQDLTRRARLGGVTSFVSGLTGGAADPTFMGLGALGRGVEEGVGALKGAITATKGAGLLTRGATGAAEGGVLMGGYTEAERKLGTAPGDKDITSYDVLRQTGYGMVIGGAVKGTFGQRLTTDTIPQLERSGAAASKQGVAEADVVSPKGAIGRFQIMPDTAREYMGADFDVKTLHDPKVNEQVAQKILDDLNKKFPNDIEAQAVAYNAGPGRAEKWIADGRNEAALPKETQNYLATLRKVTAEPRGPANDNPVEEAANLPPEVKTNAAQTSVAQAMEDSDGNVAPVIRAGLTGSPAGLEDAIPKPGSAIINDRLNAEMLARIDAAHEAAPPAVKADTEESPELTALKSQATEATAMAEHAHQMAFGAEGKPFKEVLDNHIEEHARVLPDDDRAIFQSPDLSKAIEAAVRCSVIKGTM